MPQHWQPLTPPDGDPGAVDAGSAAWEGWAADLASAADRLTAVVAQLDDLQGDSVTAARARLDLLGARTSRLSSVLEDAAEVLRTYARVLDSTQIEARAAIRADDDAHAEYDATQRLVDLLSDDLLLCTAPGAAADVQTSLARRRTDQLAAREDERAAVARLQDAHDDARDAAGTAATGLTLVETPADVPLSVGASSPQTLRLAARLDTDLSEAAAPAAAERTFARLRVLLSEHGEEPQVCAELFFGDDADVYRALAVAGRRDDQAFVDLVIRAAAVAGLSRGELMTKVAFHQMREWRTSPEAMQIRLTMHDSGLPVSALAVRAYALLGAQFRPWGPWDAKPELWEMLYPELPSGHPDKMWIRFDPHGQISYDVFGNVQFGYMLAEFGVPAAASVPASHVPVAGKTDPGDDVALLLGDELFDTFPQVPTLDEFESFLSSPGVIEKLRAGDKIRELG